MTSYTPLKNGLKIQDSNLSRCIAGGFAIGLGFGFGVQVMMKWLRRQGATSDQQVSLCLV